MKTLYRIGQIVPSSNITMETESPGNAAGAPTDPA
jgi:maleate cis-trans isomerase